MGDPKKHRKKYSTPIHPWQRERIEVEIDIKKRYGLRKKYEIWKMSSLLKTATSQAKQLMATTSKQAEKEKHQLLERLISLGLLKKGAKVEDVLKLTLGDIMERRLQTILVRKALARTMLQSRQFILHEHISIADKKIKSPSYLVLAEEESKIQFHTISQMADVNHPERLIQQKQDKSQKKGKAKEAKEETEAPEKVPNLIAEAEE